MHLPGMNAATDHWLVMAHEASNSGAPRVLLEVLRAIREARHPAWSCDIVLRRGGPLVRDFADLGPTHRLAHNWADGPGVLSRLVDRLVDRPFIQARRLARWMEAHRGTKFGLVYANTAVNGRWLPALRALGCPVLTHAHELEYSMRRFNSPAALAATVRCTDHFIAVSSAVAHDLVALGVPAERVTRVPNFLRELPAAADPAGTRGAICGELGLPPGTRLVTACGHIDWVKGPDLFVEMAAILSRQISPVAFVWLGGDGDRVLGRRVRFDVLRRRLGNRVRFCGPVSSPQRYLAASNVVTVTSRVESFSRVALEAGALGRPVLGFAAARGPADLIPADSLVGELSAAAMAAAVKDLLDHPAEAERRGRRLRERIATDFMASKWTGEILAITEALRRA